MPDWLILRTSSRSTLRLAASLTSEGIEAWSPRIVMDRRRPRGRGRMERTVAIMPSFVFARASHIDRLHALAELPGSHDQFSIFRHYDTLPLIADSALEPLRSAEVREVSKARRRTYRPGQTVRVPEGSFGGMSGIVEKSDGGFTMVCFGGNIRVKIATFHLRGDVAQAA